MIGTAREARALCPRLLLPAPSAGAAAGRNCRILCESDAKREKN